MGQDEELGQNERSVAAPASRVRWTEFCVPASVKGVSAMERDRLSGGVLVPDHPATENPTPDDLAQIIEALRRPGAFEHPAERIELHETHISWVILAGPFAYKIKKPVNLGFVDFSTLEQRAADCEREL